MVAVAVSMAIQCLGLTHICHGLIRLSYRAALAGRMGTATRPKSRLRSTLVRPSSPQAALHSQRTRTAIQGHIVKWVRTARSHLRQGETTCHRHRQRRSPTVVTAALPARYHILRYHIRSEMLDLGWVAFQRQVVPIPPALPRVDLEHGGGRLSSESWKTQSMVCRKSHADVLRSKRTVMHDAARSSRI